MNKHPWRSLITLLLLCIALQASAQQQQLTFDGVSYIQAFQHDGEDGQIIEYIPKGTTLDKWKKLIAFRRQARPDIDNDPLRAAQALKRALTDSQPTAQSQLLFNRNSNEALIDFLVWKNDQPFVELNLFRFTRSQDGEAILSLQIAQRFDGQGADAVQQIRNAREHLIPLASDFDLKLARDALDQLP